MRPSNEQHIYCKVYLYKFDIFNSYLTVSREDQRLLDLLSYITSCNGSLPFLASLRISHDAVKGKFNSITVVVIFYTCIIQCM